MTAASARQLANFIGTGRTAQAAVDEVLSKAEPRSVDVQLSAFDLGVRLSRAELALQIVDEQLQHARAMFGEAGFKLAEPRLRLAQEDIREWRRAAVDALAELKRKDAEQ